MSELPKGWKFAQLKDVSKIVTGNTPSRSESSYYGGNIPWVKPSDLDKADPVLTSDEYLSEKGAAKARLIPKGSVIVSCIGNLGKLGYAGCEMATNQQINSIIFDDKLIFSRYGYYYAKNLKSWMEENASSTTIQILNKSRFETAPVYYPTLTEQRRIVERLELLLGKINKAKGKLEKIPSILKRFRQSVLSSACSGKLTADWRERNKCGEWEKLELENLVRELRIGPFGTLLHASDYVENGIPVINPKNIVSQHIIPDYNKSITKETFERLSSYRLNEGDILIARRGEMGRTAPVTSNEDGWLCGTGSMIIRLKSQFNPLLYSQLLSGQETVMYLEMNCKGSTMKNLNETIVKNIPLPSIPIPEQEEIICRINTLFALAGKIECRYKNAKVQLARAEKAIYAKAFRGELEMLERENS